MDALSNKIDERPVSQGSDSSYVDVQAEMWDWDDRPSSNDRYPAKLHARAVAKELGVSKGLIYLPGLAAINYEDSDQPVHFRQRRYFYYLSGINFPGCVVTYNIQYNSVNAWIPPPRNGASVIYNGPNPTAEEVMRESDFDQVSLITDLSKYVANYAAYEKGKIYILHNYQAPKNISYPQFFDASSEEYNPYKYDDLFDFELLKPAMDAAKVIKSPYEIRMIRKANYITAKAHTNVLLSIKKLHNEADIEGLFTATSIAYQAKEQAYGIIAASGENASTLHYATNNEPLVGRELVCLDAGAEWKCYASDVTRTFPISGKFSKEAKQIYDLVAQMQESCINMVRPGVNYRDIHINAHKIAICGLLKLGILKGGFDDLFAAGAAVPFFPHGLGHFLGLEVHDFGDGGYLLYGFDTHPGDWARAFEQMINPYAPVRPASVLKENQVITIEPGIYFSRYALEQVYLKNEKYAKLINKDLLKKYYPVGGVRIEDDILVTKHGYENLTTALKGDEALKIINSGSKKGLTDRLWPRRSRLFGGVA